ncbi:MAG: hypothetical protein ACI8X5_003186 [Planctomycetota bacterium]|jgi:hypothetical protein
MRRNLRKKNLVRPVLQIKMTLAFMATSAVLMALMGCLVIWQLTDSSGSDPMFSDRVLSEVMPALSSSFVITMVLLMPVTMVVGVLSTFLVAGPLTRFEMFLKSVKAGENPADCKLRDGDELGEFCALLNDVTRPLREEADRDEPQFVHTKRPAAPGDEFSEAA